MADQVVIVGKPRHIVTEVPVRTVIVRQEQRQQIAAGQMGPHGPTGPTGVPVARIITFPASLTGSQTKARVAATAQTDFDLQQNGSSVGTIRFAASGTVATYVGVSGFSTAAGDVLSIIAPASPDATLADIGFCLSGTR